MKILVYDIAASSSGALTVLLDFYEQVKEHNHNNIEWYFLISTPELEASDRIKILRYPWIKKNWLYRIYFDIFCAKRICKNENIDYIISLQNTIIPRVSIPQNILLHNCLSLIDYSFSFWTERILWLNQKCVGMVIKRSLKHASKIVVQTNWMKKLCINKYQINELKINVVPTYIRTTNIEYQKYKYNQNIFFYPAMALKHKNHIIILKAAKVLLDKNIKDFTIRFTLNKDNKNTRELYSFAISNNIPVEWLGEITERDMYKNYFESILIFPSYFESYGLPLYEARKCNSLILANNTEYAQEALQNYKNAYFFNISSEHELADLMQSCIENKMRYYSMQENSIAIEASLYDVITNFR